MIRALQNKWVTRVNTFMVLATKNYCERGQENQSLFGWSGTSANVKNVILQAKPHVKAIFHCGRFARAGGATNFNHVKNQSRGHAKKVECSSTSMACPRASRRTKNAQVRPNYREN